MPVLYVLIAVLIFGALILIHEGGHFLFARLFGVTVREFAIGMGPAIVSHTSKKTGIKYALRLIPFGGYVSMVGEDEDSDDPNAFNKKPVWQRIIITAAGASMNLIAGVIVMTVLVFSLDHLTSTSVHRFRTLLPEDQIVAVEGIPVENSAEIAYHMIRANGGSVTLSVERDGKTVTLENVSFADADSFAAQSVLRGSDRILSVNGASVSADADIFAALLPEKSSLNVTVERQGHPEAFVLSGLTADMLKGGSAAFGLRENDRILEVDGTSVHTANELVYEVMRKGIHPVDLTVRRGEETVVLEDVEFRAVTESGERFGEIDFYVHTEDKTFSNVVKHAFFRSVSSIKMIPETLFDMLTGRYSVKSVSGPVGVTQVMSEAASRSMDELLYIVVVLTMNLGVMNLLPLPALDGGRLVFQLIELIRGKPVPARVEGYVHFAGLVVLMLLMVLILAKDIAALFV